MKNIFDAIKEHNKLNENEQLIIGAPEDGEDYHFSRRGCDLINTLACDVVEVDCLILTRNIFGRVIHENHFKANVCHAVLDAYHNGTVYFQNERGDWVPEWDMNLKKRA